MSRAIRIAVRILLGLLGFVILAVAILHLAMSTEAVQKRVRARLEALLGRELDRRVQIEKITVSTLLTFLELHQIVVSGRGDTPLVEVGHVRIYVDLPSLLHRGPIFTTVVLVRPVFHLSAGAWAADGRPEDQRHPPTRIPVRAILGLPVDRVQIRDGQVFYRTGDRQWSGRGLEADLWRVEGEIRSALRIAEGVIDLPGQPLRWRDLQGRVTLADGTLVIPRLEADVGGGSLGVSGRIHAVFEAPDLALDVTATFPFTTILGLPGIARMGGRLAGSGATPRFEGVGRFEGGVWPDFGFRLRADREGIRGDKLAFLTVASEVSGSFHLRWSDFQYAAAVRGRGVALDRLLIPGFGLLPVSGTLALDGVAEGQGISPRNLKGQAHFEIGGLRRRGEAGEGGRAEGAVTAQGGRVSVERLQVEFLPNRLQMKGAVWKEVDLEVAGTFPRVDLLGPLISAQGLGGKGQVAGRVRGTLVHPTFRGRLTWETPRLLGVDLDAIRGEILVEERTLSAPSLTVTKGRSSALLALRLAVPEKAEPLDLAHDLRVDAQGQVAGNLADVLSVFVRRPLPVHGRLSLDARLAGVPARLAGEGHFVVREATLVGEPWSVVEGDLKLEPDRLVFEDLRLARGSEQATGSGGLRFADLETNFRLIAARLSLDKFHLLAGTGLTGMMRVDAQGAGRIGNPRISGTVDLTALRYGTLPFGSGRGSFRVEGHAMTADLTFPERGYNVAATLRATSPYAYDVRITLKESELAPLLALTGVGLLRGSTGTGTGTAQVGGDLGAPGPSSLALALEIPDLRVQGHSFHTTVPLRIEMREGLVTVGPATLSGMTGWLHARGQIAFAGAVDLTVRGKIPLALLLHRPGTLTDATGTGELDLAIAGPWLTPRYVGLLKVAGGGFRLTDHPDAFQKIGGKVSFEGDKIPVATLDGEFAGGRVTVSGSAARSPGVGWRWVVDLGLEDAEAGRVFPRTGKGKGTVSGRTQIAGSITAEGNRWSALEESLTGKVKLTMKEGRFRGLTVLTNILRVVNLTPDPAVGMPYDSLRANFTLKHGILETHDLQFVSDTVKVGGVGTIDLRSSEVDMLLGVQPLRMVDRVINFLRLSKIPVLGRLLFGKERSVLVIAVKVRGPWAETEVVAVPEESLGRGLFGIFRRLLELPGEASPSEKSGRSK